MPKPAIKGSKAGPFVHKPITMPAIKGISQYKKGISPLCARSMRFRKYLKHDLMFKPPLKYNYPAGIEMKITTDRVPRAGIFSDFRAKSGCFADSWFRSCYFSNDP